MTQISSRESPIAPDTTGLSLEAKIDTAALILATAPTKGERVAAWGALQRLCNLRTQERVKQMELERGLR